MANRILILFAHPTLEKSRVQRHLAAAVRDLEGVTFHDLYEAYPDLHIQVEREQELLRTHDIVVFQHPFYWYSSPAILKEWQDLVLEYGFAYGDQGTALCGKRMLTVTTGGGTPASYSEGGANHFTVRQFLTPFEQTARLCGMDYLPPFVVLDAQNLTAAQISAHAADYRRILTALRHDALDLPTARTFSHINADLSELFPAEEEAS